jgi:hypothetical protein
MKIYNCCLLLVGGRSDYRKNGFAVFNYSIHTGLQLYKVLHISK